MTKNYMIGNWKMNQTQKEVTTFFNELNELGVPEGNFGIAPQLIHIPLAQSLTKKTSVKIGAQNCSSENFGAFTGETSTDSLKDLGVEFTLIGHSERRSYYNESDSIINKKVIKALSTNLLPVLCIGETLEERKADKTLDIVLGQIKAGLQSVKLENSDQIILAYEPVWAIGTGETATPDQAEEVHLAIRNLLKELYGSVGEKISLLYGGSVKPENVVELLAKPNINGGLVGGASLKAESFYALCKACL